MTRNEILEQVRGDRVIVTARNVDRCVTTLRAGIEPDPRETTLITTGHDVGDRFAPGMLAQCGGNVDYTAHRFPLPQEFLDG